MEDINDRFEGSYEQGCLTVCAPYSVCATFCALLNYRFSDSTTSIHERADSFALHVTAGGLCGVCLGLHELARQEVCDHSCLCGKCRKFKRALQTGRSAVQKMN